MMYSIMRSIMRAVGLWGALLCAACQGASTAVDRFGLAGTSWELVALQTKDLAQPGIAIAEPARFTLQFGTDGRAVMRLDCNRGNGSWQAQPASADAGTLIFGAIATTRALCAPPHLDERIARDLSGVRFYSRAGDMLMLSPTTDGGVMQWRRRTLR
jgi:heat shock protein HslJ